MADNDIVIKLSIDDMDFSVGINSASVGLKKLAHSIGLVAPKMKQMEHAQRGAWDGFRDGVIVLGLMRHALMNLDAAFLSLPRSIININGELERTKALMKGLSTTQGSPLEIEQEATENLQKIFDLAKNSPYEVSALTDVFVKLKSAGIDPLDGSMQALVDSVAKFGGAPDVMKRAAIAISQMAGKGVLSMEELRQQFGEAVPTAMKLTARALGISVGALVDQISKGVVEADSALKAMFRQMAIENTGAAAAMAQTWDGLMNRLKTQMTEAAKTIGQGGLFEAAKEQLNILLDTMNTQAFQQAMFAAGQALGDFLRVITDGAKWLAQHKDLLGYLVEALKVYVAISIAVAVKTRLVEIAAKSAAASLTAYNAQQERATAGAMGLGAALTRAKVALTSISLPTVTAAAATRGLGIALSGLGVVLRSVWTFLGGWVGLIATAAYAVWAWYDKLQGKHEETVRALKETPITLMDPEEKTRLEALVKDAENLRRLIDYEKIKAKTTYIYPEDIRRLEGYQKRLAEIDQEVGGVDNRIVEAAQNIEGSAAKATEAYVKQAEGRLNAAMKNDIVGYEKKLNDLIADNDTATLAKREENLKKRAALEDELIAKINETIAEEERALRKKLTLVKDDDLASVDQIKAQLNGLEELRKKRIEVFKPAGGFETLTGKGAEKSPVEKYESGLKIKLAKLQANLEGANPFLEEFMERFDEGMFPGLAKDSAKFKEIIGLLERLNALTNERKLGAENKTRLSEISDRYGQMAASIDNTFRKRANQNPFLSDFEAAEDFRRKIAEVALELQNMQNLTVDGQRQRDKLLKDYADQSGKAVLLATRASADRFQEEADQINRELLPAYDKINAEYDDMIENLDEWREVAARNNGLSMEEIGKLNNYIAAINAKRARELETPIQKLGREWADLTTNMNEVWATAMDNFVSTLADALVEGELDLNSFFQSFAKMIIEAQLRAAAAGLIGNIFGGVASTNMQGQSAALTNNAAYVKNFANGGIMTSLGALQLRKYANGGIANRPQLALYGEGRQPEAYVPLPDGRTIPVTMTGGQQQGQAAPVVINVINESGQPVTAESGKPRFDGKQMIYDIILSGMSRPGAFRDGMREAIRR